MSKSHRRTIDRNAVLDMIKRLWPTHMTEVAQAMGYLAANSSGKERKAVLTHLKYHFDQLAREDKINVKKIGQAVVAWPHEMEKMRIIHSMLE
ncbi:MAG: hypothetical protein AABW54_00965 [Candidatus Micrarchaeota archaeon]